MNVFFKLKFEKLHNFQLFTFNFQLFPGGVRRADCPRYRQAQRAVEDGGQGLAALRAGCRLACRFRGPEQADGRLAVPLL